MMKISGWIFCLHEKNVLNCDPWLEGISEILIKKTKIFFSQTPIIFPNALTSDSVNFFVMLNFLPMISLKGVDDLAARYRLDVEKYEQIDIVLCLSLISFLIVKVLTQNQFFGNQKLIFLRMQRNCYNQRFEFLNHISNFLEFFWILFNTFMIFFEFLFKLGMQSTLWFQKQFAGLDRLLHFEN